MFEFFHKKQKNVIVVHTKEELDLAIKRKEPYIEVEGELAGKLEWKS